MQSITRKKNDDISLRKSESLDWHLVQKSFEKIPITLDEIH